MALSEPSKSFSITPMTVSSSTHINVAVENVTAGDLKNGHCVLIKGFPCKVVDIRFSKTGKHGSCKATFFGIDVLTKRKYPWVGPSDSAMQTFTLMRQNYSLIDVIIEKDQKGAEVDRIAEVDFMDDAGKSCRTSIDMSTAKQLMKLLENGKIINLSIVRAPSQQKKNNDEYMTLEAIESFQIE